MFIFYKTNLLKISFGQGDVKEFRIKGAAYIVIKYIITENAHASKKRTAHTTWRQEVRVIQSKGQPTKEFNIS